MSEDLPKELFYSGSRARLKNSLSNEILRKISSHFVPKKTYEVDFQDGETVFLYPDKGESLPVGRDLLKRILN